MKLTQQIKTFEEVSENFKRIKKAFENLNPGGGSWGTIGGNIGDQSDLVSYVGTAASQGNTAFGWGNHADAGYLKTVNWGDMPADVTRMGNAFNGPSRLVLLDSGSRLPAVDGSLLTNLPTLPSQLNKAGTLLTTNGVSAMWSNELSSGTGTALSLKQTSGTNSPLITLSVAPGGVGPVISIPESTTNRVLLNYWDKFQIGLNGRVGIGTTSFTDKEILKVNGDMVTNGKILGVTSMSMHGLTLSHLYSSNKALLSLESQPGGIIDPSLPLMLITHRGNGSVFNIKASGQYDISFGKGGTLNIGTIDEISSAILNLKSETKGFLQPRQSLTQFATIPSKAEGLMAWNTTDKGQMWFDGTGIIGFRLNRTANKFQGYDGSNWIDLN